MQYYQSDTNKGFETHSEEQANYNAGQTQAPPPYNSNYQRPNILPNSSTILTLGILSIVSLCCCGPFLGIILSIIALSMSSKAGKLVLTSQNIYTPGSISNYKAGKICAIIGLCLGALSLAFLIFSILAETAFTLQMQETIYDVWNEMNY